MEAGRFDLLCSQLSIRTAMFRVFKVIIILKLYFKVQILFTLSVINFKAKNCARDFGGARVHVEKWSSLWRHLADGVLD